jgi:ketosteroid isomerase-like protein
VGNVDIVRRLFELAAEGDVDGYAAHVDPRAELPGYFHDGADSETTVEASPLRFEERGDSVLVPGRIRIRNGGSLSDSPVFWIMTLREGKVVHSAAYGTEEEAEAALAHGK